MKCNQAGCDQRAVYRYARPGRPEVGICKGHPDELAVIRALMVPLNLVIDPEEGMKGMVEVHCEHCGGPFKAKAYDIKRGWGRFCSKSCKAIKQEQRRKAQNTFSRPQRVGRLERIAKPDCCT